MLAFKRCAIIRYLWLILAQLLRVLIESILACKKCVIIRHLWLILVQLLRVLIERILAFKNCVIIRHLWLILVGSFPNLTRAYGNNGRRPRQKFVFGILQLLIANFSVTATCTHRDNFRF